MEPRPNRPNKPSSKRTAPVAQEPWDPSDQAAGPQSADIYVQPPNASTGGPWYGPSGSLGPEPVEYQNARPPMPIRPKNERGHRWLKYLMGTLLLALVIGGSAFAITKFLDRDGNNDAPVVAAVTSTPNPQQQTAALPTATQVVQNAVTPTQQSAEEPTQASESVQTDPTQSADSAPASGNDQSANTASDSNADQAEPVTAASLIPDPASLDGDWVVTDSGERSKAEVGAQLGEGGEDLLTNWRWRENVYSDLTRSNPGSFPDETTFLSISVHRFANEEGASEATQYLADIVVSAQGLEDINDVTIGDETRALAGPGDGVNLYVLYVRNGNFLIRLGGASATGDPAPYVNDVALQIVEA